MAYPRVSEATKRARGTLRRDRMLKPDIPAVTLRAPAWLSAPAKSVWGELASVLAAHEIGSALDVHSIARYCSIEAMRRQAEQAGHTNTAIKCAKLCETIAGKFGMTPVDRLKLPTVRAPKVDDKKRKYFRGGQSPEERFFGELES